MISFSKPVEFSGSYTVVIVAGLFVVLASFLFVKSRTAAQAEETDIPTVEKYKATVRSFRSFFNTLLPIEFQFEPINVLFRKQLVLEHDLSVICNKQATHGKFSPKVVVLARLLFILGANVVLALLYYPTETACTNLNTRMKCTASTTISIIGKVCIWDEDSQQCDDAETNELFAFTVFCAFAVSITSSVAVQALKFLVSHAATAIKNKRLHWLYFCCVPGMESHKILSFRTIKVAPKGSSSAAIDAETGETGLAAVNVRAKPAPASNNKSSSSSSGKEAFRLREILREQEEAAAMIHFGDEWTALEAQSRKATIMRAARCSIMKARLDYTSTAQELHYLLHHSRERYLWMESADKPHKGSNWFNSLWKAVRLRQLSQYDFGDPHNSLELMDLAHLLHPSLIERKLSRSRTRATALRSRLSQLPDGPDRDKYLLQAFLVDSLSGYKRAVAQAVVFEAGEEEDAREQRVIWQYLALLLLPFYFIIALGVVFYGGLAVTAAAGWLWLRCVLLSLAVHLLWQQPLLIWALHVWFPGCAKKDVLALHWVLQARARSILSRRRGVLYSMNALVQHFHPACRTARLLPHLPVSRLLLSLSDYDLPVAAVLRRPRRRSAHYPSAQVFNTGSPLVSDRCEYICINVYSRYRWLYNLANRATMAVLRLLLHGLYRLPRWGRELAVEVTLAVVLTGFLLAVYELNKINADYTILLLVAVVLAVSVGAYKIYRDWLREMQMLHRLERQRIRYQLNCNPIDNINSDSTANLTSASTVATVISSSKKVQVLPSTSSIRQPDQEESKQEVVLV